MSCDKHAMLLYGVTDRAWIGRQSLYEQVQSALEGGVTCIQLREKTMDDSAFLSEALRVQKLCHTYGVPFIINDDVELAVKCGADGVHVGQNDRNAMNVRKLIGTDKILGVSVQTVQQAIDAEKAGADYLGAGAVFPTTTKLDACVVPYKTLKEICNAVSIPVVAIGGICSSNLLELSGSGVDGVALVSAIFSAEDIERTCRVLRALSEKMVRTSHEV